MESSSNLIPTFHTFDLSELKEQASPNEEVNQPPLKKRKKSKAENEFDDSLDAYLKSIEIEPFFERVFDDSLNAYMAKSIL